MVIIYFLKLPMDPIMLIWKLLQKKRPRIVEQEEKATLDNYVGGCVDFKKIRKVSVRIKWKSYNNWIIKTLIFLKKWGIRSIFTIGEQLRKTKFVY